ncbi:MAG: hypothetical protein FJX57_08150 [Alphaproteobacteria bacterium]|nr:hypothetical protein [Alphaproteobacteria bacterium]
MLDAFADWISDGLVDRAIELIDGLEGLVGEVAALEVAPGTLDVVELRGYLGSHSTVIQDRCSRD